MFWNTQTLNNKYIIKKVPHTQIKLNKEERWSAIITNQSDNITATRKKFLLRLVLNANTGFTPIYHADLHNVYIFEPCRVAFSKYLHTGYAVCKVIKGGAKSSSHEGERETMVISDEANLLVAKYFGIVSSICFALQYVKIFFFVF